MTGSAVRPAPPLRRVIQLTLGMIDAGLDPAGEAHARGR
jgi:hypothetical protein